MASGDAVTLEASRWQVPDDEVLFYGPRLVLCKLFQIFESQLKIRYIVTIYGKSKIGRLSAMLDNAESDE